MQNTGDDLSFFPIILLTSSHSLSFLACLWLFIDYFRFQEKTLGSKMMIVLGFSQFIFHAAAILALWEGYIPIYIDQNILGKVFIGTMHFSLQWICVMGFILLKSVSLDGESNSDYFSIQFGKLLVIPLILSIG